MSSFSSMFTTLRITEISREHVDIFHMGEGRTMLYPHKTCIRGYLIHKHKGHVEIELEIPYGDPMLEKKGLEKFLKWYFQVERVIGIDQK